MAGGVTGSPSDAPELDLSKVGGSSVAEVYASLSASLGDYLREHFRVDIKSAVLPQARAFLVAPRAPGRRYSLVIAEDTSDAEMIALCIHMTAHMLCGHLTEPFASVVEPRRREKTPSFAMAEWERRQHAEADIVASEFFWSTAWGGNLAARLVPGWKFAVLRRALALGVSPKAIVAGLELGRKAHSLPGLQSILGPNSCHAMRKLYCAGEILQESSVLCDWGSARRLLACEKPAPRDLKTHKDTNGATSPVTDGSDR